MTPRTIRAYLRGATAAKVIWGWKQIAVDVFHVNPYPAPVVSLDTSDAISYCRGLAETGIEPMYVTTELLPAELAP